MIPVKLRIEVTGWKHYLLFLFTKKRRTIHIPTDWSEVENWRAVLSVHLRKDSMSNQVFKLSLLKVLLKLPDWLFYRLPSIVIQEQLLPLIRWAINLKIEKPFSASIKIAGQNWMIPNEGLTNVPIQQYFLLERRFFELVNKGASIEYFLAALLRPQTKTSKADLIKTGVLAIVSSYQLQQYEQQLSAVDDATKLYLIQYYANQRIQLREKYPSLHKNTKSQKEAPDWDSICPMIASLNVFGPLDAVLSTPCIYYLAYANARAEESEEKPKTLQEAIKSNHQQMIR